MPTNKLFAPDDAQTSAGWAEDIMVATILPRHTNDSYAPKTKKYILNESGLGPANHQRTAQSDSKHS